MLVVSVSFSKKPVKSNKIQNFHRCISRGYFEAELQGYSFG
jgi:hypothetical protein